MEIFCAIHSGASILVLPQSFKQVPAKLADFLIQNEVNILQVYFLLNSIKNNKKNVKLIYLFYNCLADTYIIQEYLGKYCQ